MRTVSQNQLFQKRKSQSTDEYKHRYEELQREEKLKKKQHKEALKSMQTEMFGSDTTQIKQRHYMLRAIDKTEVAQREQDKKKKALSSAQNNEDSFKVDNFGRVN